MPKIVSLPKYCLHKARGLAYMRVQGKFIYLGEYDSPDSDKITMFFDRYAGPDPRYGIQRLFT